MAKAKCSICGKIKPLYNGVCLECKAVKTYDNNIKLEDAEHESEYNNEDEKAFDSFTQFRLKELRKKHEAQEQAKRDEAEGITEHERYEKLSNTEKRNYDLDLLCTINHLSDAIKLKYRPQLLTIIKNYRFEVFSGLYSVSLKDDYERTGQGTVEAVVGNFVLREFIAERHEGVEVSTQMLIDTDDLIDLLGVDVEDGEETSELEKQAQEDASDMGVTLDTELED